MRIVVADHQVLFRRGLAALIRLALPDCDIAEADGLAAAEQLHAKWPAEILLAAVDAEGPGARRQLRALHATCPDLQIAVLGSVSDRSGALAWLEAGATGCICASATPEELCDALRTVSAGHGYVSAALLTAPAHMSEATQEDATGELTARQRDVMRLLAEGRPTKDIARRLGLSVSTVKAHLAAAYRSLGAHNRVEAVVRSGVVAEPALVD